MAIREAPPEPNVHRPPAPTAPAVGIAAPIIEVRGLVKRYGTTVALGGLDLSVREGEIFGILGPNGAGKTTTLELIEGLRAPDAGSVRVAGLDPIADGAALRRLIGVQLQTTALFDTLSARELIALFANLYGADASVGRVDALLALVGLTDKSRSRTHQLSGGQRQRLAIALALVNRPRIAILDEPTTGLDPAARRALWQTIRGIRGEGTTVLLTTHFMDEAETLCDRVAIIDHGRLITSGPPAALVRDLGLAATIRASVGAGTLPAATLSTLPAVLGAEVASLAGQATLLLRSGDAQATLVGLLALAAAHGVHLTDLGSRQATLEDVFLTLTGRQYEGDPAAGIGEREVAVTGRRAVAGRRRRHP